MTSNAMMDGFKLPAGSAPVACVDVGGTKVAVQVVDEHGAHGKLQEPTVKTGTNDALAQQIIRMVGLSCVAAGISLAAVARVGVSSGELRRGQRPRDGVDIATPSRGAGPVSAWRELQRGRRRSVYPGPSCVLLLR